MYEHLTGRLAAKSPAEAVVECAGVGYRLRIPLSTFEALPAAGVECRIFTHLHVREDTMALYGFATPEERTAFRRMLGVSGIGPNLALTVLSGMPVGRLARAVADGDAAELTRVKGIGDKTAKRVVLELKGVLDDLAVAEPARALNPKAADAVSALVNLGYPEQTAEKMVDKAMVDRGDEAPVEEIIRAALAKAG